MTRRWGEPSEERSSEPAPLGEVVAGLLGRRELARGAVVGRLLLAWPEVVGERLANETSPARLEAGTLHVWATTGQWGAQARFLAEEIRRRANETLGSEEIERVRVAVRPGD